MHAIRFDQDRLETSGRPIPIVDGVLSFPSGAANFSVSASGSLVSIPETDTNPVLTPRTLEWVSRSESSS